MATSTRKYDFDGPVTLQTVTAKIEGVLTIPLRANAVVLFAHGSGSGRFSPRNLFVAGVLNDAGLATLLIDLLTVEEQAVDEQTGRLRFDIPLLASRLVGAIDWLRENESARQLRIACFGASTGAAAALIAAAERPDWVCAVVSRGGRPDLAWDALPRVVSPTLLIVGGNDPVVLEMNQRALERLYVEKSLRIVPGATHLFEEPGTLEEMSELARDWFVDHCGAGG
jgi:putative phosphoribosyl transferase